MRIIILLFLYLLSTGISMLAKDITIYTPNGTAIVVTDGEDVFLPDDTNWRASERNYFLNHFNNRITVVAPATYTYNCHGYAWHMTEGGGRVWMDGPYHENYWNDGSFVPADSLSGTKVAWEYGDHSAITTEEPGMLESKWGILNVFRHTIEDCPYSEIPPIIAYYYIKNCHKRIENTIINTNKTETGCIIDVKNTKTNAGKTILNATTTTPNTIPIREVNLYPSFEVETGAELEINVVP